MTENMFLPVGLPLLNDHVLLKTVAEYRHARMLLVTSCLPSGSETQHELEAAIDAIETELDQRGLLRLFHRDRPEMEPQDDNG